MPGSWKTYFYSRSYPIAFWSIYGIIQALSIVDRFTTQVWPRQTFNKGNLTFGGDPFELKKGPWSVKFYDVFARITGRYSMHALNALIFTMMHSLHYYLERTWIGRKLVDFSNSAARTRIHIQVGISLCVLMFIHIWSILLPGMFNGWSVVVKSGHFRFPLSEGKPQGLKDMYYEKKTTMLQVDDVARLLVMTIILGPLMYQSFRWLGRNYRVGIRVHQLIFIIYFIDIVRRHTHPHSWILNVPPFFAWCIDKYFSYRWRHQKVTANILHVSEDYVLVYYKLQQPQFTRIVQEYYIRVKGYGRKIERRHAFTTFKNRDNILANIAGEVQDNILVVNRGIVSRPYGHGVRIQKFNIPQTLDQKNKGKDAEKLRSSLTTACICKVYQKDSSHTKILASEESHTVNVWPLHHSNMITRLLERPTTLLLVAGGAAVNYIIDVVSYVSVHDVRATVHVMVTTNDWQLFRWVVRVFNDIPRRTKSDWHATVALTSSGNKHDITGFQGNLQTNSHREVISFQWGRLQFGRIDFVEEFEDHQERITDVFCQGSSGIQGAVKKACKKFSKFTYHESHTFDG